MQVASFQHVQGLANPERDMLGQRGFGHGTILPETAICGMTGFSSIPLEVCRP